MTSTEGGPGKFQSCQRVDGLSDNKGTFAIPRNALRSLEVIVIDEEQGDEKWMCCPDFVFHLNAVKTETNFMHFTGAEGEVFDGGVESRGN